MNVDFSLQTHPALTESLLCRLRTDILPALYRTWASRWNAKGAFRGAFCTNRAPIEQPLASHFQNRHNVEREPAFKSTVHPHDFSGSTQLTTDVAISILTLRVDENSTVSIQTKTAHNVPTHLPYMRILHLSLTSFRHLFFSSPPRFTLPRLTTWTFL